MGAPHPHAAAAATTTAAGTPTYTILVAALEKLSPLAHGGRVRFPTAQPARTTWGRAWRASTPSAGRRWFPTNHRVQGVEWEARRPILMANFVQEARAWA